MTSSMIRLKNIFYELIDKKLSKDRAFAEINKIKKTKIVRGYIHGMNSILYGKRRKFSIDPNNIEKKEIKYLLKTINRKINNPFLPAFEKGFLIAWKDYLEKINTK